MKIAKASSFTFGKYKVNTSSSTISFTYHVEFKKGKIKTYTDKLFLKNIKPELWEKIPKTVLEPTLQALLLMLGINYWCVFPTKNIHIEGFSLTREQADFWNTLYLNGLGEFFYDMKMDFHDLIAFPYKDTMSTPTPTRFERPFRTLLLNGAGKDSILSSEILKASNIPFDFFAFAPTPAHKKIATLVGAKTIEVSRRRDSSIENTRSWYGVSNAYPSVSTFTFIATLLAELLGYNSIIFSNERSADFGNLTYLGLCVNHQWCKSSEAEKITNDYIQKYITPDISTKSLLREFSELEIVKRFVQYPKYLHYVTSCNNYFWLPRFAQVLSRKSYWCKHCPKCVFLFASFSAFLSKKELIDIFGANLYTHKNLLPLFKQILGIEGFKPLDCVGEPEEMILAMHYASIRKEYTGEPAMQIFEEHFPPNYDFEKLKPKVFESE
ncbi:MAG: hypothetical protein K9L98_02235 [Candidatus Pacebacteria bacterium]|nr:hypothetical protein [Candidatus Paceibacterota bacterium]MCF7862805.1 hypothetical protein [Candidatus Paceibacterota bacterium]